MRFAIRFLRHRGRVIPWRHVANQRPRVGDLRVEEVLDPDLHRYVRIARLCDTARVIGDDDAPQLLDVRLMGMSPRAFSLTGFERVDGVDFAQSWLVSDVGFLA